MITKSDATRLNETQQNQAENFAKKHGKSTLFSRKKTVVISVVGLLLVAAISVAFVFWIAPLREQSKIRKIASQYMQAYTENNLLEMEKYSLFSEKSIFEHKAQADPNHYFGIPENSGKSIYEIYAAFYGGEAHNWEEYAKVKNEYTKSLLRERMGDDYSVLCDIKNMQYLDEYAIKATFAQIEKNCVDELLPVYYTVNDIEQALEIEIDVLFAGSKMDEYLNDHPGETTTQKINLLFYEINSKWLVVNVIISPY